MSATQRGKPCLRLAMGVAAFVGVATGFTFWSTPADGQSGPVIGSVRPATRFVTVDVYVDPGDSPLAAWQLEFLAEDSNARIVAIEGGDEAPYHDPPYYDPAALQGHRVILAAYTVADDPPSRRTRVARLHLELPEGTQPGYVVRLATAIDVQATPIPARATASPVD